MTKFKVKSASGQVLLAEAPDRAAAEAAVGGLSAEQLSEVRAGEVRETPAPLSGQRRFSWLWWITALPAMVGGKAAVQGVVKGDAGLGLVGLGLIGFAAMLGWLLHSITKGSPRAGGS